MKVVYSPQSLEYSFPDHPESPERVRLIYDRLKTSRQFAFVQAKKAKEKDLLLVHSNDLVEKIKNNNFSDPDTPNIPSIFNYALLAVGASLQAAEIARKEHFAFALVRPPGHHATRNNIGGFCYFNNIAISCTKLIKTGEKVAVLDIDAHHGNGTQDILFGRKGVLYCSLHQIPLYPGTGYKSERNCLNFPIAAHSDFSVYKKELVRAIDKIESFTPDILAVSLGFDTYQYDPMANIDLEEKDYEEIGRTIAKLDIPTFFVLEGGYSKDIGIMARNFFLGVLDY